MTEQRYLTYLDFDLAIEVLAAGTTAEREPTGREATVPAATDTTAPTYRARVLHSPAGQATVDFTLPFQPHELELYILKMGRPRRGVRSMNTQEGQAAQDFGTRLYNAIFRDEVRDALRRSLDAADAKPDHGLRIRLRLRDAPDLLDLPWEYLYDPSLRRFFCHSVTTPLVRYPQQPRPVAPLTVTPPLQVLVMIANPHDVALLDVEAEWRKVREALAPLVASGMVQLTRLENATLLMLQRQLRQGRYHIFHFVGHGGVSPLTGERVLYLEDETGRARPVGGDYLGTLLRDHRSLRLALLNACEGARAGADDPFAGVAQHLILQGIPAIIAMQFEITDDASIALAHEFYAALADGYPIEAALAEARKAIFVMGNDIEWGTPVLYTRASNGLLFRLAGVASTGSATVNLKSVPTQRSADNTIEEPKLPATSSDNAPVTKESVSNEPSMERIVATPTRQPTEPITGNEERTDTKKPQTERSDRSNIRNERKPTSTPWPVQATKRRNWRMIVSLVVGVPVMIYASVSGYNAYDERQQPIRATATAERLQAQATTLTPQINATATAMVNADGDKLELLAERYTMEFVPVPGGPFMMGNPVGIGDSDEQPAHEIEVADFWIGKTEVINAQYRFFVDAGGYRQERWWTDAGWSWLQANPEISQPRYWGDEEYQEFNGDQQPVIGVSWYEATAYATWLTAETELEIRLPTEAEWEKAARGVDARIYPWGNESPNDQLLNYNRNVNATVDVGSYLAGASPYGALDMAGNVWEWTATRWVANYDNYANVVYNGKEGAESRALRGGSWSDDSYVRSASRLRDGPGDRGDFIGFRLVVFAPGG